MIGLYKWNDTSGTIQKCITSCYGFGIHGVELSRIHGQCPSVYHAWQGPQKLYDGDEAAIS